MYEYSKNLPFDEKKKSANTHGRGRNKSKLKLQSKQKKAVKDVEIYLKQLNYYFHHQYTVPENARRFQRENVYMSNVHQKEVDEYGNRPWDERRIRWGLVEE